MGFFNNKNAEPYRTAPRCEECHKFLALERLYRKYVREKAETICLLVAENRALRMQLEKLQNQADDCGDACDNLQDIENHFFGSGGDLRAAVEGEFKD